MIDKITGMCPYCYSRMEIEKLKCPSCDISIEGAIPISRLARLSVEQQKFIEEFIIASGSLKEMAEKMNVSYPTIRNKLDRIIEALTNDKDKISERRQSILDAVEEGKISAEEASKLLNVK